MDKIDARTLPQEVLEHLRRQAFLLREKGYTWAHIAEVCGVNIWTVMNWSRRAREEGMETVIKGGQRGRRHGSGRTLTQEQENLIRRTLVESSPGEMKLEFALWNRRAVMQLIKQECGLDMPIRTVGEYLRRWGFTPQRPAKRALEQDPARIDHWLNTEYPQIAQRAKAENAEIYWGDETAIRQDTHWVRGYAPAGQTPLLRTPASQRASTSMISAITNQGLVRFDFFEGAIDAERFIQFLQDLIHDAERKVFLIVDNLRVHHARRVRDWLPQHADEIEVFYLPPYAPEHNPDKYLNRALKTSIRSGPIAKTRKALKEIVREYMQDIVAAPEQVRAYFKHESVRYAALLER